MMKEKVKKFIPAAVSVIPAVFGFLSVNKMQSGSWGLWTLALIPVIILLSYFSVKFFIDDHKEAKSIWKVMLELAILFVFGTGLIKSFIIYIYPIAKMYPISAIIYGFGWSMIGMAVTYLLKHFILKISWQGEKYSGRGILAFLKFCIPSIVILGAVFAIYYPGVGTVDTEYVWEIVHTNSYTDTHPIMFLLMCKGLSLLWDNIAVITLFQYIICTLAYGYVAYYFASKGLKKIWCWIIAFALPLVPINAFYTVMLWKDIPYSIVLLVFTIQIIKVLEDSYLSRTSNIIKLILSGMGVMFLRHNGFIPVIGTSGLICLLYLVKKNYRLMFKMAAVAVVSVVAFYGIKTGVGMALNRASEAAASTAETEKTAVSSDVSESEEGEEGNTVSYDNKTMMFFIFPRTIALQQLIYIENYYGDSFTDKQKEDFAKFLIPEQVEAHKFEYRMGNEYGPNWEFYHKPYLTQRSVPRDKMYEFWDYYFEICKQHPITALESYQKLTGITWASVGYGPTALRGTADDRFARYVSEDYYEFMAPVRAALDASLFKVYNGMFIVFSRPAFYLIIICLFGFAGYRRHKWKYAISMSPVFLNLSGYLVVIAAQDVRYFFINTLTFIVAIAYAAMKPRKIEETSSDEITPGRI